MVRRSAPTRTPPHRLAAHVFDRVLVPNQSELLTVSYMCQRQSSASMLPSEAATPPCPATVWLRVGNTWVIKAVFGPRAPTPNLARRPAPPAPTTTTS